MSSYLQDCIEAYTEIPNGNPRNETEMSILLALAAQPSSDEGSEHPVIAAKVQLAHLGFPGYQLNLSEQERRILVEIASKRSREEEVPASKGHDAIKVRCSRAWSFVEEKREEKKRRGEKVEKDLSRLLPEGLSLQPHQIEMVRRISEASHRFLLFDDMGLGKTIEAIASLALLEEDAFPIVIVSPLSVVYNWRKEVEKWLANASPRVHQMTSSMDLDAIAEEKARGENLVLTGSWQQLIGWCDLLVQKLKPRTLVGDESHYMANWKSQRTRAFIKLRGSVDNVLCLTGTPEPNGRHRELFAQIKAVAGRNAFDHLPGGRNSPWKAYARRYCDPKTLFLGKKKNGQPRKRTSYEGRSNDVEFGWLLARYSLRRTKSEVFGEEGLPPKTRYQIPIEISNAQRLKIAATRDAVREDLLAKAKEVEESMQERGCTHEEIRQKVKSILSSQAMTELGRVRRVVSEIKRKWSVRTAKELRSEGHRVVIFCEFLETAREVADALEKAQPGTVLRGIGSMPMNQRGRLVERAQEDESIQYVVLTQAFREGITLTAYDRMIFVDRWWLPGWEMQGEDRIHRIGQTRNTAILFPHVEGSTDEAMAKVQVWKESGSEQILGSAQIRAYTWLFHEEAS